MWGGWLSSGCPDITKNCRVDTACESGWSSNVGQSPDPVVGYLLICLEDEGITLTSKNLDGIYAEGLNIITIYFDDYLVIEVSTRRLSHPVNSERTNV